MHFGLPDALWQSFGLTLRLAALTTVALAVVGLPLAHRRNRSRWRLAPAVEYGKFGPLPLPLLRPTGVGQS